MFEITKNTMISEILENAPQAMPAFQSIGIIGKLKPDVVFSKGGFVSVGCALSSGETLEQACYAHEVDPDQFLADLKAYLAMC